MSYDYSENILVQESAGNLLRDELQWDVKFAYNTEVLGDNGTFGRKSYKEILLVRYFRAALKKLNPWITEAQILEAQVALEKRLSTASLLQVNEEKYFLIRDGIPVTVKRPDGKTETKKAAVIDFLHPENNYFLAVKELKIHGDLYRRRTDIVGFVNGLPLLFVELKKNTVDVQNAYDDNYTDYQDTIPHLFYYNAFLILSNGTEAKVGTLGSKYEFFHEWKRLDEKEQGSVALETMLRGICKVQLDDSPEHSLTEFRCEDCTVVKGACRNRQNAAAMAEERRQREENGETLPPERPAKPQRAERPARSERAPRSERPERQPKGERPPRPEKPERPARGERQPRPEKPERIEKNANPAETGENAAAEPREGAPRRRSRGGRRHRRPQNGENAPAPQNSAE